MAIEDSAGAGEVMTGAVGRERRVREAWMSVYLEATG